MPQGDISEEKKKEMRGFLHEELLRYASENNAEGVREVVEKYVPLNLDININYVQKLSDNGIRREQTALVIALREGYTQIADYLIENGADLNRALSLAFLFFSEESLLHNELISRGADVWEAFDLVIKHKYIQDYKQKKARERQEILEIRRRLRNLKRSERLKELDKLNKLTRNNEKDEKDEKQIRLTSKLLLLALKHKPGDNGLPQLVYSLEGGDPNDALSLAIESYQPGDESSISWLILRLIRKDTLKAEVTAAKSGASTYFPMASSEELEASVNLNKALSMILERMSGESLVTVMLKISEIVNPNKILYHVLKHKPENDNLRLMLISKGADINKLLETVIEENPKGCEIISMLISKGASLDSALHSAITHHPNDNELISTLISKGADVNYVVDSEKKCRILHEAINKGCPEEVIRCLLEKGADPKKEMIVARGGCEQIGFALLTLTNPIGWLYLSCLFCARGDSGNPFTKKYINALGLARLKHACYAESAIEQHLEVLSKNEKTPLLGP